MNYSVPESWYEGVYRDENKIISAARPFKILNGNTKAVLLIHGYAGYPGELVRPAKDLALAGFDVYCPRLPGMGTSGKDFMQSNKNDWLKVIDNALNYLTDRYNKVDIVAHSMGTLLALIAAQKYNIEKIVLAAPAFSMPQLKSFQLRLISMFKKDIKIEWKADSRYKMYYENAPCDDELLGREYWSHLYTKRLLDLDNLKTQALKINNLKSKILILECLKDSVTNPQGCDDFISKHSSLDCTIVHLKDATHFVYYDIDKSAEEKAVRATVDFLS